MNLTTKYLQDAQGNKYAPVTVPSAVRWANGDDLDDKLSAVGGAIPVVWLYEPSTPESGVVMFDASDTNKFYQYTMQGRWVEISTPHKAIGVSSNDDVYEIIDGVLSQTPIADFEYNTWYIYYTGGLRYQIGQVVFIGEYSGGGGLLPTWDDIGNWNNKQDAITFNSTYDATTNPAATMADVSGKEDKMSIVNAGLKTSYSPVINTLTRIGMQSSLTVTLPSISTDTDKVQSLVLILEAYPNYSPNLSIVGQSGDIIYFPPDFSIEANKTYEINCMWAGNDTWIVASHEIFYGGA